VFLSALFVTLARADWNVRFADVAPVGGSMLAALDGLPVERLALLACHSGCCTPIPFQIDERDPEGRWTLEHGPLPTFDTPPGVLDDNDLLLFMAADAGERAAARDLPGDRAIEIALSDPLDGSTRWAYLLAFSTPAPRAGATYVHYDPETDRIHGRRVSLGFRDGIPGYLAVDDAENLLDRFEVRAAATFFFGLIHFSRDEGDLTTQFDAWRQGPIRVIRGQRQWVRLGWGIRSPTFGSYTYFYRDFAELPVGLRLNFPPTYFFGDIVVRVILDFRDLHGWSLLVPSLPAPLPIDGTMTAQKEELNRLPDTWFALLGPQVTLLQRMEVGPSLASVRHQFLYHEDAARPEPPESIPGARPAVGYRLDRWEAVGAGAHFLAAVSYALPVDVDVRRFMVSRQVPLAVSATPIR
jgi:hypothetical protein